MPYGTIKVDNITFTNGGSDQTVTVSGLYASTSGNLTVTGTVSGTTANFVSGTFSTQLSGATITGNVGRFTTVTGVSATLTTATITSGIFAAGTATAPSVAIGVGTTYTPGIYAPGTDQVAISTSGTGRLFVSSSGNVGIGTNSPGALLDISTGATSLGLRLQGTASPYFSVLDSTASVQSLVASDGTGLAGVFGTISNHPTIFRTNNTERLRITSAGNVGIGTVNPGQALDVRGSVRSSIGTGTGVGGAGYALYQFGTSATATENWHIGSEGDGSFRFYNQGIGAGTERLRITSAGDVGIGTSSPGVKLDVAGQIRAFDTVDLRLNPIPAGNAGIVGTYSNHDLVFYRNNAERLRIDSSGRLLVGTSSYRPVGDPFTPSNVIFNEGSGSGTYQVFVGVHNRADIQGPNITLGKSRGTNSGDVTVVQNGDRLGEINFCGADGVDLESRAAQIAVEVDGTPGANDMPGRLVFSTTADGASSPSERARITSDGFLLVGKVSTDINVAGSLVNSSGSAAFTRSGDIGLFVGRNTNDGALVVFRQDGTDEGSISVSGTTVSYNGAHLSRWSQLPSGAKRIEILRGTVLSNVDEMCGWGDEENEQLNRMKTSDVEGDPNVAGVFQGWDDDDDTYPDDFYCAMTGDFIVRIADGVTVQRGDLLMSAGDGTAKPQDDDIIRSKTVAKVTSTHVTCTYDDGSYCVPCVLMAC